MAGLIDDDAE